MSVYSLAILHERAFGPTAMNGSLQTELAYEARIKIATDPEHDTVGLAVTHQTAGLWICPTKGSGCTSQTVLGRVQDLEIKDRMHIIYEVAIATRQDNLTCGQRGPGVACTRPRSSLALSSVEASSG